MVILQDKYFEITNKKKKNLSYNFSIQTWLNKQHILSYCKQ